MVKSGTSNVMACGACAVFMDADGETTTSIDLLVGGVKRLLAKRSHGGSVKGVTAAVYR